MTILKEPALESFFKSGAQSLKAVLFYGQDEGLIEECRQKATLSVVPDAKDSFNIVDLDASNVVADSSLLFSEADSVSLLGGGGRRVIRIRNADNKLSSVMKDYLATCKSDALIVVTAPMLAKGTSLRTLFEKAGNAGVFSCYADDGERLKRLAMQTLRENGLTASSDVIDAIADNLGADRMVSRSELAKLVMYMGERKTVTTDDVAACIGDASFLSIDNFLYALSAGNFELSQKTLEKLYAEGQAPIALLRAATAHFKRFHQAQGKISNGESVDSAMNALRLNFKRKDDFKAQLKIWSLPKISRALDILCQTETGCKTKESPQALLCARAFLQIASFAKRR